VVVGGGWWVVVWGKLSDRLWLSFSLALAKPNNNYILLFIWHTSH
jgi:hypothetical protein